MLLSFVLVIFSSIFVNESLILTAYIMKTVNKNKQFKELSDEDLKQVTGGNESQLDEICSVKKEEHDACLANGGVWERCKCL